ncbi:hypothetical protein CCB80_03280 [Armatimonadetes bacterium Uphvl-Ar1]|nr:hypothetical protein CCB80_03280 [Armatimonadetes bacterium Uphvl-Ar1]
MQQQPYNPLALGGDGVSFAGFILASTFALDTLADDLAHHVKDQVLKAGKGGKRAWLIDVTLRGPSRDAVSTLRTTVEFIGPESVELDTHFFLNSLCHRQEVSLSMPFVPNAWFVRLDVHSLDNVIDSEVAA